MKKTKIFAVIAAVALSLTTSLVAFAANSTPSDLPGERPAITAEQKAEVQSKMAGRLEQALEDGRITQEQHDAVIDGFQSGEIPDSGWRGFGHGAKGERPELTDEQMVDMQTKMKARLDQALAEGKLTQEQYDAIINGIQDFQNGEKPSFGEWDFGRGSEGERSDFGEGKFGHGFNGEMPELTEEQKADMQSRMTGFLDQALESGMITQEQYDAIINAIQTGEMPDFGAMGFGRGFRGERPAMTDEQNADATNFHGGRGFWGRTGVSGAGTQSVPTNSAGISI